MYDPDAGYDDDDPYRPPPSGQVTPPSPSSPGRPSYPWWTDPDNPPPAWMLDPHTPPIRAGGGMYWNWAGDHWEQRNSPTGPSSAPPQGPPAGGGDTPPPGGGGSNPYTFGGAQHPNEGFQWPQYAGPRFGFKDFPGFKPFTPPSADEILNDPVLNAQLTEGNKRIKQDRAFRGILNTGDTLKDIFDWTSDRIKLGGHDAFERAFKVYDVNDRQNPFNTWSANKGLALDTFNANAPQIRDEFEYNQYRPAQALWKQNYDQWAKTGDWLTEASRPPA